MRPIAMIVSALGAMLLVVVLGLGPVTPPRGEIGESGPTLNDLESKLDAVLEGLGGAGGSCCACEGTVTTTSYQVPDEGGLVDLLSQPSGVKRLLLSNSRNSPNGSPTRFELRSRVSVSSFVTIAHVSVFNGETTVVELGANFDQLRLVNPAGASVEVVATVVRCVP
ncbi:MAG: hypothetical protein AAFR38_14135 [Planctomycetota bacterium]